MALLASMLLLLACLGSLAARRAAARREMAGRMLSPGADARPDILASWRSLLRGAAARPLTPGRRLLLCALLSLAISLLTRNPLLAAIAWPGCIYAPRALEALRRGKAEARMEEQILELIDSLHQSLRSGLSLQQSLEAGADDVEGEMRSEVLRVLRDLRLGGGLEETLTRAAEASACPSFRLTFTVLGLLHSKGGDLPRILERLRRRVAEGLEVRRESRILTSQSRASGYLVSSLPPVFLLLQALLNPRSLRPLFATPLGNAIIAAAIALNAAAFFLIRKMVNPEV